jgi:hypothetical protein
MAVQLAEREKRIANPMARNVYPITKTVSGSEWARIITTVSGALISVDAATFPFRENTYTFSSNAAEGFSICTLSYASVADYDSSFVTEMLAADAAEPEATFNNVVDMLGWLNRE